MLQYSNKIGSGRRRSRKGDGDEEMDYWKGSSVNGETMEMTRGEYEG